MIKAIYIVYVLEGWVEIDQFIKQPHVTYVVLARNVTFSNVAMDTLKSTGKVTFEVGDVTVKLAEEDLLFEQTKQEGFASVTYKGMSVVIDTKLFEELLEEGFVGEVISKI